MSEQISTLQATEDAILIQVYPEGLQPVERTRREKCEEEGAAEPPHCPLHHWR